MGLKAQGTFYLLTCPTASATNRTHAGMQLRSLTVWAGAHRHARPAGPPPKCRCCCSAPHSCVCTCTAALRSHTAASRTRTWGWCRQSGKRSGTPAPAMPAQRVIKSIVLQAQGRQRHGPVGRRVREQPDMRARRVACIRWAASGMHPLGGGHPTSGSNAESWWLGPQPLPQVEQGTYVMVLPVSTITANFLAGDPAQGKAAAAQSHARQHLPHRRCLTATPPHAHQDTRRHRSTCRSGHSSVGRGWEAERAPCQAAATPGMRFRPPAHTAEGPHP